LDLHPENYCLSPLLLNPIELSSKYLGTIKTQI
jgi:hypothetical protein